MSLFVKQWSNFLSLLLLINAAMCFMLISSSPKRNVAANDSNRLRHKMYWILKDQEKLASTQPKQSNKRDRAADSEPYRSSERTRT